MGLFWDQWQIAYIHCCLYSYGFLVRQLRLHIPVSLTLTAILGRSKGKMISTSKLGTVAGKCVHVCPGHSLNFHIHASIGWFWVCVQIFRLSVRLGFGSSIGLCGFTILIAKQRIQSIMLTWSNFCSCQKQCLSECRIVGSSYRVPLCINRNIIGVVGVSAVFFHLVNNYLKMNLKWPNSLTNTFCIGSYVHWSAVEVYPGSGTHELAADRDCSNLPQQWAFVLEMLPKIKVRAVAESWKGANRWDFNWEVVAEQL